MDWKEALSGLKMPDAEEENRPEAEATPEQPEKSPADKLSIFIEKKGRGGKTATIIAGFTCDDKRLQATARELKQKIGTGGSARGGEILLQGEWREKAKDLLKLMGYKF